MGEATRDPTPLMPLITEVDQAISTVKDGNFRPYNWDDMKSIVGMHV